jgi:RNA polymerase sigma-70 factor (ECF subfamily)
MRSIDPKLLEEFWQQSDASSFGIAQDNLADVLSGIGAARNYGQPAGAAPSREQQAAFLRSLRLSDLVLARACANGNERAWEHFLNLYSQPLTRAAIAIAGSETKGRDLSDALYAEVYGLSVGQVNGVTQTEPKRRCPLDSYQGRGSLIGWLRTVLAQRHVDQHRRTWREQPLSGPAGEDDAAHYDLPAPEPQPESNAAELSLLVKAIEAALKHLAAEERFLLASYYLDGRTLLQIARILQVHEATVSRKLRRLTDDLRKQLLRNLQNAGLSKRAAQEALGADPRDLDLNLKKLLQSSQSEAFSEKAGK